MYFAPTMQRSCFYGTGPQNTVPYLPFQPPLQNNVQNPEIIGEGDVTSVILPNGSVQYFFIPTLKRDVWAPYAYTPPTMNVNWNVTSQAWFVRNISNPIAPSFCFGQQYLRPYGDPFNTNVMPSDCNPNTPALGYTNMFHYDKCSSTTDLHCFYPSFRSNEQQTTASLQFNAAAPQSSVCLYELVCGQPCPCGVTSGNTKYCKDDSGTQPDRAESAMSIEGVERNNCDCPPPQKHTLDKGVDTSCDSTFDESSKEVSVSGRSKGEITRQSLGKEKGVETTRTKEKPQMQSKATSLSETDLKKNSSKGETIYRRKSSDHKSEKIEGSGNSDKEKFSDDEKKSKCPKCEKKYEKCYCDNKNKSDNGDNKPKVDEKKRDSDKHKSDDDEIKRDNAEIKRDNDKIKRDNAEIKRDNDKIKRENDKNENNENKRNNNEKKGKCCNCSRKRNKEAAEAEAAKAEAAKVKAEEAKAEEAKAAKAAADAEIASQSEKLSLIEIIGHCDGNCCCSRCNNMDDSES